MLKLLEYYCKKLFYGNNRISSYETVDMQMTIICPEEILHHSYQLPHEIQHFSSTKNHKITFQNEKCFQMPWKITSISLQCFEKYHPPE